MADATSVVREHPLERPFELYDPLYGTIKVTSLERNLLLTRPFLRARNIKQIGTGAFLKNAPHTRFMHSIGVLHLVDLSLVHLFRDGLPDMTVDSSTGPLSLTGDQAHQCIRLGALLHDIGHGPLSHVLESHIRRLARQQQRNLWAELAPPSILNLSGETDSRPPSHEDVTRIMIASPQYGISSVIDSDVDLPEGSVEVVSGLAVGLFPEKEYGALGQLISGSIDMDRLDYSLRDTYYLGRVGRSVGYSGSFDWQKFLAALVLYDRPGIRPSKGLGIKEDGIHLLDQFFSLRSRFLEEVSRNRDVRIADLHFVAALEGLYEDEAWNVTQIRKVMTDWSDDQLIHKLASGGQAEVLGKIMTGPHSFGAHSHYLLNRYPSVLKYRLICHSQDEDYKLERLLTDRLGKHLGLDQQSCKVLVGLNTPTDGPVARIVLKEGGDEPGPDSQAGSVVTRHYADMSSYARAFAKDTFHSTELTVVAPHVDDHKRTEAFIDSVFSTAVNSDPTDSELWRLLDQARPPTWDAGNRSTRLDLLLVSLDALFEHSADALLETLRPGADPPLRAAAVDGLWIRSLMGVHYFTCAVQQLFVDRLQHPYSFSGPSGKPYSSDLAKDVFLLEQAGLVRSMRSPVPRKQGSPYSLRFDTQLAQPAKDVVHWLMATDEAWGIASRQVHDWLRSRGKALRHDLSYVMCVGHADCPEDVCNRHPSGFPACSVLITSSPGPTF